MADDNDDNLTVTFSMPSRLRDFVPDMEYLLPLRMLCRKYRKQGGIINTHATYSESHFTGAGDGRIFGMRVNAPIIGHGCIMDGNFCMYQEYYGIGTLELMREGIKSMIQNNNNTTPSSKSMKRLWMNSYKSTKEGLYFPEGGSDNVWCKPYAKAGPLTLYNFQAMREAQMDDTDPFLIGMYSELEAIKSHGGIYGLIHDNTVVDMGPEVGDDNNPDLKNRMPRVDHGGFLCSIFTPQSKAAGRVRALACGTQVRMVNDNTNKLVGELIDVAITEKGKGPEEWFLRWGGLVTKVNLAGVKAIVKKWSMSIECDGPTVHVFEEHKLIVISTANGTVVRPLVVDPTKPNCVEKGPYVDSMLVHNSDTLRFAGLEFPKKETSPYQYFNTVAWFIPYAEYTTEPRLNLGIQMMRQALNRSFVEGDATLRSVRKSVLRITTPIGMKVAMETSNIDTMSIPGVCATVAFINRELNTEDACSVMEEWANSGVMAWSGFLSYPLPNRIFPPVPGQIIMDEEWWKPAVPGIVIAVRCSKTNDIYIEVFIASNNLDIGDKLATEHGLKFTVGEKIKEKDMPMLTDVETGETFKPVILLSVKNMVRGLGGQLRHMRKLIDNYPNPSVSRFRLKLGVVPTVVVRPDDNDTKLNNLPQAFIMDPLGKKKLTIKSVADGSINNVRCSYGYINLLHLRHMSSLKHHYPSETFRGATVPRGRYRGGTPRLGECELMAMYMQQLPITVRDSVISSDLCEITVCSACNRLTIMCDCGSIGTVKEVTVRRSMVMMDVMAFLGMINRSPDDCGSLKYLINP